MLSKKNCAFPCVKKKVGFIRSELGLQDPFTRKLKGKSPSVAIRNAQLSSRDDTPRILDDMANNGIDPALIAKKPPRRKRKSSNSLTHYCLFPIASNKAIALITVKMDLPVWTIWSCNKTKCGYNAAKTVLAPQGRFYRRSPHWSNAEISPLYFFELFIDSLYTFSKICIRLYDNILWVM